MDADLGDELADVLHSSLAYLTAALDVPPTPAWRTATAITSMDRFRQELVRDEPIPDLAKGLLQRMMLDWLCVYDMSSMATHFGLAPWRLDGMLSLIRRIVMCAGDVGTLLGIELNPPGSE